MKPLNDQAIRLAFKTHFFRSKKEALVDELDLLRGRSRVDLIHFGEFVTGYEIKSDRDSLIRLTLQADTYNKSLEKIVLICGCKHTEILTEKLPRWWGIIEAKSVGRKVSFREIRPSQLSPFFNHANLLDLLWKNELELILLNYGFDKLQSKTRFELKNLIKSVAPYFEIKEQIVNLLNQRETHSPVEQPS